MAAKFTGVENIMKYKYTYRTSAFDLWQLSMYYTYGSIVGVCNVILTVAMFALTIRQWNIASLSFRVLMILGCSLFTVIQPLLVYRRAKKQASGMDQNMEIYFDDYGVHVKSGEQTSDAPWNTIKKVSKKPTMIIIFSNTTHGFVMSNRVLGQQKEEFYAYVISKMKK